MKYLFAFVSALLLLTTNSCGNGEKGSIPNTEERISEKVAVNKETDTDENVNSAPKETKKYTVSIKNSYPHDKRSYTQGLLFHKGYFYESAGQRGVSSLRKVEVETGKIVKRIDLSPVFFAEGLALLNDRLYQVTWRSQTCLVYDLDTFEEIKKIDYFGEGWGLAEYQGNLAFSDGSDQIKILEPDGLTTLRTIFVRGERGPVGYLNELEVIEGKIWANVYTRDIIVIIDPETGFAEGEINLSNLRKELVDNASAEVLNGIAYDPATKRIWVTGKDWNRLFEIELIEE